MNVWNNPGRSLVLVGAMLLITCSISPWFNIYQNQQLEYSFKGVETPLGNIIIMTSLIAIVICITFVGTPGKSYSIFLSLVGIGILYFIVQFSREATPLVLDDSYGIETIPTIFHYLLFIGALLFSIGGLIKTPVENNNHEEPTIAQKETAILNIVAAENKDTENVNKKGIDYFLEIKEIWDKLNIDNKKTEEDLIDELKTKNFYNDASKNIGPNSALIETYEQVIRLRFAVLRLYKLSNLLILMFADSEDKDTNERFGAVCGFDSKKEALLLECENRLLSIRSWIELYWLGISIPQEKWNEK